MKGRPEETAQREDTMKNALAIFIACLLSFTVLATMPGCGPSNEEVIQKAVAEKYDAYKSIDDEALSNLVSSLENEGLSELGIDETEFGAAIVEGFDYHIDQITVNGNTATVTITFAGKSYTDLLASISQTTEDLASNPEFLSLSQENKRVMVGEMIMDAFGDLEIKNETVDLTYELVDNQWQEADNRAGLKQIDNILFAR